MTSLRRWCSLCVAAGALAGRPAASVQAQAPQVPATLTPALRSGLVDSIAERLERSYIEADTGRLIAEGIRKRFRAGAYDRLDNPAQFADAVTRDLRAVNGDLHLGLRFSSGGGGPQGPGDPRRINFGIGKVEILDGNVGYLEITGFAGAPGYEEAVADALKLLARTDALIIDLRRNGGGSSEMSHLVFSHFLPADPVETIRVKRRGAEPVVRRSMAVVPGPRRTDVPLFLLTSRGTASAAEEFTFVLKNRHRATLVGSRTAGAGHMVNGFPVGSGFILSVSFTRVSDPATGKEWEQVGVEPDSAVPPDEALTVAHAAALRGALAASKDPEWTRSLTRSLAALEARRRPPGGRPAASWLTRVAGDYEGRMVSVKAGRLFYTRRAGGLGEELTWLGGTRFALGPVQLQFDDVGGQVRLTLEPPDGTRLTLRRTGGSPPPGGKT